MQVSGVGVMKVRRPMLLENAIFVSLIRGVADRRCEAVRRRCELISIKEPSGIS